MSVALDRNGVRVIDSVEVATTFWARMTGLMGRRPIPPGHALMIPHCGSVHTFFMRFDLDLFFLDSEGRIVKVARNVTPYRIVLGGMRAATTVEIAAGWLEAKALQPGDLVTLSGANSPRTGPSRI